MKHSKITTSAIMVTALFGLSMVQQAYAKAGPGGMPPAVVEICQPQEITWQDPIFANGTLTASQGVTLYSEVDGKITSVLAESGQQVTAGQPLIQTNPNLLQARLESAHADYALALQNYQRAQKVYRQKVISGAEFDQVNAKYAAAKAALKLAEAQMEQTYIRAPFAGRLGIRQVTLGEFLTAGKPVFSIQATDPLKIDFYVPEKYIRAVQAGQKVIISNKQDHIQKIEGKVVAVDTVVEPNSRSLLVRASVPNPLHNLLPGEFVEVEVLSGTPQKVITVPQTAVNYASEGDFVFKVVDHKAVSTPVQTGQLIENNLLIIKKGLSAQDHIVCVGGIKVQDGAGVVTQEEMASHPPQH